MLVAVLVNFTTAVATAVTTAVATAVLVTAAATAVLVTAIALGLCGRKAREDSFEEGENRPTSF